MLAVSDVDKYFFFFLSVYIRLSIALITQSSFFKHRLINQQHSKLIISKTEHSVLKTSH